MRDAVEMAGSVCLSIDTPGIAEDDEVCGWIEMRDRATDLAGSAGAPVAVPGDRDSHWTKYKPSGRLKSMADLSSVESHEPEGPHRRELASVISNMVVREITRAVGRGPTRARTTLGQDVIIVVLEDTLTKGERTLLETGEGEAVLTIRRLWQKAMREKCCKQIENLTGRRVAAFLSDDHVDPDIAVEVFVLLPAP